MSSTMYYTLMNKPQDYDRHTTDTPQNNHVKVLTLVVLANQRGCPGALSSRSFQLPLSGWLASSCIPGTYPRARNSLTLL